MKDKENPNTPPQNIHDLETEKTAKLRIEQVQKIKKQVSQGGLRFEVYLPPGMAEWVLDMVEKGRFLDPSEAVFVFMGLAKDIDAYPDLYNDLHGEILKRRVKESEEDIGKGKYYTHEELKKHIKERLSNKTEPAVWEKNSLE